MLTLAGEPFLSRQGVGILMSTGLPEWIAADTDDYVARAVTHAKDLQRLTTLRNGLRQQVLASPITDAPPPPALHDISRLTCMECGR